MGTVVRLPDGVESDGPLKAGQLAVITTEDGSSNPYRVRTADGVEQGYWFVLRALVEAEGGMVSLRAAGCRSAQFHFMLVRWAHFRSVC